MSYKGLKIEQVLEQLKTNPIFGLTEEEAKKRLEEFGYNKIAEKKRFSALVIFFRQFYDFLTLILIVSTLIALFVNKIPTAIAVGIVVIINIILGFIMEYKSEKSLEALKNMLVPKSRVIRNGKEQLIDFSLIVPGDVIVINEGQKIPADARIIEEANLKADESPLTGESMPVQKYTDSNIPVQKKENQKMVFLGTTAVTGHGKAIVIATGKKTEFGKIAQSLSEIKEPLTPLQKQVINLGKLITFIGFILAILLLILGQLQGIHFLSSEQLMLALSIFISITPSGLLVVMTLTLAIGVQRMAKDKTIIKRLSSVETLGSTQIICTDKTGTLTENKMTAKKIWTGGKFFDIGDSFNSTQSKDVDFLIRAGIICNSATVHKNKKGGWDILGDPTEASLLILGEKAGYPENKVKSKGKILKEFSFEQELRRRAVVFEENEEISFFSIGSPENILEISAFYLQNEKIIALDEKNREEVEKVFLSLAANGYRIIGLSSKKITAQQEYSRKNLEKEMVFLGLVALYDPPRPEVKSAIQECKDAGVRVVMITGDNELTALAIAKEVGLVDKDEKVIKGEDIEKYNDKELLDIVNNYNIFARTKPIDKLRIVEAFQRQDKVVAVTGDGVNDAPALKEANIGAAMGIRGTDVSKEAADMIIIDDNFVSISKAVKQGRIIYDNIKKFIKFLLTANVIETPLIMTAILLGLPMPILPLHILWINFVTDSLPAMTLGIEPGSKDVMKRKPRHPKEHILKGIIPFIIFASFLGYVFSLGIFKWFYNPDPTNLIFAQTMTFTFIVIYKLFLTFSCRSKETIFHLGFFTNKKMVLAVIFSFILQIIVIYSYFMQELFITTTLTFSDWLIIFFFAVIGFLLIEAKKLLFNSSRLTKFGFASRLFNK